MMVTSCDSWFWSNRLLLADDGPKCALRRVNSKGTPESGVIIVTSSAGKTRAWRAPML